MGYPVNGISYVLNNWEFLKERYPYYVFFLFTNENESFSKFFQEYFYHLDETSGDGCMFFAIAPPPDDWSEHARNRDYWQYYLANADRNIGYDRDAVFQAARYFDVPKEHLPTMVIFQDIQRDDAVTVQLGKLDPPQWLGFLDNLFEVFKFVRRRDLPDLYSRGLKNLIEFLPVQRMSTDWLHNFAKLFASPKIPQFAIRGKSPVYGGKELNRRHTAHRIEYPDRIEYILRGMQEEISRLSSEISELRSEQRESFHQVNVHLEEIQAVLRETIDRVEAFREPFIEKWVALENADISPEEFVTARQDLNGQFDDFLLEQSTYLSRRLNFTVAKLPSPIDRYEHLLEPASKSSLITTELLWTELDCADSAWLDYSVCGIGLWKALEIELNRTFVDSLRVYHRLCSSGVFSVDQLVAVSGELNEKAKVRNGKIQINRSRVDDQSGTRKLLSIELGGIAGLLELSDENTLAMVIQRANLMVPGSDSSVHEYIRKIGKNVSVVANNYRNSHAHIRPMSLAKYQEFRTFMLENTDEHNPLSATLQCKEAFLNTGLI